MTARRLLPLAGMMAAIFLASHQPGDYLPPLALFGFDKVLHALAYGALAIAFLYGFAPSLKGVPPWLACCLTILFCLLYGLTDEYHQTMVPGRTFSLGDLAADVFGGGVAGLIRLFCRRAAQ